MTQINYIQFHIGDFLGGVIGFDATETGAYMMLICAHYQAGIQGLPDDDEYLARIAKVGLKSWRKIRQRLVTKFEIKDGFWVSERVAKELLRVNEVSARNSAKALKRHNPDHAAAEPRQCKPITNNQEPVRKKDSPSSPPRGEDPFPVPDWLDTQAWSEYRKHRGKTFKRNAQKLAIGKLERWRAQGHDPTEIINNSIMNGWKGLFEPKEKNFNGPHQPKLTPHDRLEAASKSALDEIIAGIDAEFEDCESGTAGKPDQTVFRNLPRLRQTPGSGQKYLAGVCDAAGTVQPGGNQGRFPDLDAATLDHADACGHSGADQ